MRTNTAVWPFQHKTWEKLERGEKRKKRTFTKTNKFWKNIQLIFFFCSSEMLWGKMYFGNPHSVWVQIDFLCTTLHKDLPPFSLLLFLLCPLPQSIYLTSARSRRSAKLADIKKRETSNDEHLFIFCPLIAVGKRKCEVSRQNIKVELSYTPRWHRTKNIQLPQYGSLLRLRWKPVPPSYLLYRAGI